MKWPVLHVKTAGELAAFVNWADNLHGSYCGHPPARTIETLNQRMGKEGMDLYVPMEAGPPIPPDFSYLHHPEGMRHRLMTPCNSLRHLSDYWARHWTKVVQ